MTITIMLKIISDKIDELKAGDVMGQYTHTTLLGISLLQEIMNEYKKQVGIVSYE